MTTAASFFDLEPFDQFERVVDAGVFTPIDRRSIVGLSDVVDSTGAVADGRYKAVNMAGAAVTEQLGAVRRPWDVKGESDRIYLQGEADIAPVTDHHAEAAE